MPTEASLIIEDWTCSELYGREPAFLVGVTTHKGDSVEMGFAVTNDGGFVMAAAIALRGDYESAQLRELARQSEDADQERRMPALALARRRLMSGRERRRIADDPASTGVSSPRHGFCSTGTLINTALRKTELISAPAIPPAHRRQSESNSGGGCSDAEPHGA